MVKKLDEFFQKDIDDVEVKIKYRLEEAQRRMDELIVLEADIKKAKADKNKKLLKQLKSIRKSLNNIINNLFISVRVAMRELAVLKRK